MNEKLSKAESLELLMEMVKERWGKIKSPAEFEDYIQWRGEKYIKQLKQEVNKGE
jgi:hypothetical protein